jgi:hypothetical protein
MTEFASSHFCTGAAGSYHRARMIASVLLRTQHRVRVIRVRVIAAIIAVIAFIAAIIARALMVRFFITPLRRRRKA